MTFNQIFMSEHHIYIQLWAHFSQASYQIRQQQHAGTYRVPDCKTLARSAPCGFLGKLFTLSCATTQKSCGIRPSKNAQAANSKKNVTSLNFRENQILERNFKCFRRIGVSQCGLKSKGWHVLVLNCSFVQCCTTSMPLN